LQEACQSKIGAYFKAQKISGTTCEDHWCWWRVILRRHWFLTFCWIPAE
jgi:hypothetical protein